MANRKNNLAERYSITPGLKLDSGIADNHPTMPEPYQGYYSPERQRGFQSMSWNVSQTGNFFHDDNTGPTRYLSR